MRAVHPSRRRSSSFESDAEALEGLARGEMHRLGEVYERHYHALHTFVQRLIGANGDVDDIVHNTFLTLARTASRYDGRASARGWLFGIAARLVQRRSRSLRRLKRMLAVFAQLAPAADLRTPDMEAGDRADVERVEALLQKLSPSKRAVLVMVEVEGMSCEEVAVALDIPVGTVWTRLHYARRELQARWEKRSAR